jgi:hypothetical protein
MNFPSEISVLPAPRNRGLLGNKAVAATAGAATALELCEALFRWPPNSFAGVATWLAGAIYFALMMRYIRLGINEQSASKAPGQ